jgi:hypothetical protein
MAVVAVRVFGIFMTIQTSKIGLRVTDDTRIITG